MWPKFHYQNLTYSETYDSPRCSEYGLSEQDKGNLLAIISLLSMRYFYAWRHPPPSFPGRCIP